MIVGDDLFSEHMPSTCACNASSKNKIYIYRDFIVVDDQVDVG